MPKHAAVPQHEKYSDDGERQHETCPRCGPGTFLADHDDRKTCGKCGYSQIEK